MSKIKAMVQGHDARSLTLGAINTYSFTTQYMETVHHKSLHHRLRKKVMFFVSIDSKWPSAVFSLLR